MEVNMSKQHFKNQFIQLEQEKVRRRNRFLKHHEVKMRLKRMWYRNPKPNHYKNSYH
jgi:hypothetical protein